MRLFDPRNLKGDVFGGVTAAVVALPLALAFGVTAGLGPIAGLYGAIAVGFFAAIFGGTPAQVSGPTGPMTVVMGAVVAQYADSLETAFTIVFLGGALQVLFGLARVGRYISYTPYSVISGFMSGIGVIIILIQILPFLGAPTAPGGPTGAVLALPDALGQVSLQAAGIAAVSLAIMVFWPRRLAAMLPAPLAALVVGTLLSLSVLSGAPVIGDVPTGLPPLQLPQISLHALSEVIQPAFVLALLGTIDSLLTSLVADSITRTHHDSNRELIGQGIGNMVSGLLGALPGAGATMRTVVNVRAGGRTRLSGALHALILLSLVLGLAPVAEVIPHAVLAGILVKVGWDIIDWGYLRRIRYAPRDKVVVMFITLGLTVFVDLITAVAVGLIVAGFVTARWMEREEMRGITTKAIADHGATEGLDPAHQAQLDALDGDVAVVALRGSFSYASARALTRELGVDVADYKVILLDFSEAAFIGTSAAKAIDELLSGLREQGVRVVLSGLEGRALKTLRALGVLETVAAQDLVANLRGAVERAAGLLGAGMVERA